MHIDVSLDILIPVYQPDDKLVKLLERLHKQSLKPGRILLVNTEEQYYNSFFKQGSRPEEIYEDVEVRHIRRQEFDHGGTRRQAVEASRAVFFVCMTDDAVPADRHLLEKLIRPLVEGKAAVSYARQLAGRDAGEGERYTRHFNYPPVSRIKTAEDLPKMGIKTFFCPNVCAAYERKTYEELGGFEERIIFNEDMVYARKVINAGKAIAYVAEARVWHCHQYTAYQQFRRNFDLGVSHTDFPEAFGDQKAGGEGIRLVLGTLKYLLKKRAYGEIPGMLWTSGWKYMGYRLGRIYRKLPLSVIRFCSMNTGYWE